MGVTSFVIEKPIISEEEKEFRRKQSLCAKRKIKLKNNRPPAERAIQTLLKKMCIEFKPQRAFIKGNFLFADYYLPKHNLVIEVDGGYHNTAKQQRRDKNRDDYLKTRGIKVLHITNDVAFKLSCEGLMQMITKSDRDRVATENKNKSA